MMPSACNSSKYDPHKVSYLAALNYNELIRLPFVANLKTNTTHGESNGSNFLGCEYCLWMGIGSPKVVQCFIPRPLRSFSWIGCTPATKVKLPSGRGSRSSSALQIRYSAVPMCCKTFKRVSFSSESSSAICRVNMLVKPLNGVGGFTD